MKMVYNSKEVANNTLDYTDLNNKPMINSVELNGNITLREIGLYPVHCVYSTVVEGEHPDNCGTWEYIGSNEVNGTTIHHYKRVS